MTTPCDTYYGLEASFGFDEQIGITRRQSVSQSDMGVVGVFYKSYISYIPPRAVSSYIYNLSFSFLGLPSCLLFSLISRSLGLSWFLFYTFSYIFAGWGMCILTCPIPFLMRYQLNILVPVLFCSKSKYFRHSIIILVAVA